MQHTPVLIVGGSLVGLSAALFLSWRNVPNILVEKHFGSSPHPRAMGFTETTIEHYRMAGIADRVPQAPAGTRLRRVTVESLAADWTDETAWTPGEAIERNPDLSPCTGAAIAQDKLEPVLRSEANALGADIRLGTELIRFGQDEKRVTAQVRERKSGAEYTLTCDYLIAADGATSRVREELGIARMGVGHLKTLRSVLFRCAEADQYLARGPQQYKIVQDGFQAFLTTYGDSRWVLMFDDDQERSEDELRVAVRRALGRPMAFDILTTGRWELAGRIAERYSEGRIFIAGDAAHQLPPTRGGFGANTGIDDVWNLAWKLERVLDGADARLLDTYDAERQPIGWLRHQQTFSRPDYASMVGNNFTPEPLFSNDAMEFGQLNRSEAVIGADASLPPAASPMDWRGQPGTRAPHAWVTKGVHRISTLDLFGREYVALTANPAWMHALRNLSIAAFQVGDDILFPDDAPFEQVFGVQDEGATLVRPDGVIAWRTNAAPTESDLAGLQTLPGRRARVP